MELRNTLYFNEKGYVTMEICSKVVKKKVLHPAFKRRILFSLHALLKGRIFISLAKWRTHDTAFNFLFVS